MLAYNNAPGCKKGTFLGRGSFAEHMHDAPLILREVHAAGSAAWQGPDPHSSQGHTYTRLCIHYIREELLCRLNHKHTTNCTTYIVNSDSAWHSRCCSEVTFADV
jgi:hypothetical protein